MEHFGGARLPPLKVLSIYLPTKNYSRGYNFEIYQIEQNGAKEHKWSILEEHDYPPKNYIKEF